MMSGKIESVQFLRIFAALLVVVAHFRQELKSYDPTSFQIIDGGYGVDIFFIVSGFVISLAAQRAKDSFEFLFKRASRILPLYWGLTIIVSFIGLFFPGLLKSHSFEVAHFIKSLFFVPFVKYSGLVQPILFVGWTLNYEIFFYAVFSANLYFFKKPLVPITAIFTILVLIGYFVSPQSTLAKFYTNSIIIEFVAGMWIFEFYARRNFQPVIGAGLLVMLGLLGLVTQTTLQLEAVRSLFALVFCGIIVFASISIRFERSRLITYGIILGDASYALYLTHPFVARVMGKILEKYDQLHSMQVAIIFFMFLLASVLVSVLVYRKLERPVTALLNRLWDESKNAGGREAYRR